MYILPVGFKVFCIMCDQYNIFTQACRLDQRIRYALTAFHTEYQALLHKTHVWCKNLMDWLNFNLFRA